MPYEDNQSLPDDIKDVLPEKAQDIFREAFNSAFDEKKDETECIKIAWAAVKEKFEKVDDKWVEKEVDDKKDDDNDDKKDDKDDGEEFEAEIFSAGIWNDDKYTIEDIDNIIQNFTLLKENVKPPLKVGHDDDSEINDGQPALGWITSLKRNGEKLIAKFANVPSIVMKALKGQNYKRISSEILWDYKYDGKVFKRVLSAVALLGADIPAVSNLEDIVIYLNTHKGKTKIYTYNIKEDDDNMGELNDYKKKTDVKMDKMNDDLKKYKKERDDLIQSNLKVKQDGQVSDLKTFCEDLVKKGSMLPAQRDILIADTVKHTYNTDGNMVISVDNVKKCFELSGKILEKKEKGNQGKGNVKSFSDASQEVDSEAKKYMTDNPKVSYTNAIKHVMDNNSELADRYLEGDYESV